MLLDTFMAPKTWSKRQYPWQCRCDFQTIDDWKTAVSAFSIPVLSIAPIILLHLGPPLRRFYQTLSSLDTHITAQTVQVSHQYRWKRQMNESQVHILVALSFLMMEQPHTQLHTTQLQLHTTSLSSMLTDLKMMSNNCMTDNQFNTVSLAWSQHLS